jgi:hypothetical protein
MEKVTMIKKDAQVNITVGVGFLESLQSSMVYVSSQQTQEELNQYEQEAQTITHPLSFSKPWMTLLFSLSNMVYAIEQAAISQGCTYDEEQDVTRLDDLSVPQPE